MTRKDYIKIAEVIRNISIRELDKKSYYTIDCLIKYMADMLEADNRSFDRDKFIKYITK